MRTQSLRLAAMAAFAGAGLLLSACNTVAGFGRDLQTLGNSMEDSAEDNGASRHHVQQAQAGPHRP
jgi:predicted small secreted protein